MTAATIPGLSEAIDKAFTEKHHNFQSTDIAIEEAIDMWWWDFQRVYWRRWDCDGDSCPGTPAWDLAMSDTGEDTRREAVAEVLALIRQRMTEFAVTFQREHPEAVLREVAETP